MTGKHHALLCGGAAISYPAGDEAEIERMRLLFDDLEAKGDLIELLTSAEQGSGVRIFIGSENPLFSLSGSSVVVAPYKNQDNHVIGALGVIGPTRLNYARIVPMVDYTANLVSRLLLSGPIHYVEMAHNMTRDTRKNLINIA